MTTDCVTSLHHVFRCPAGLFIVSDCVLGMECCNCDRHEATENIEQQCCCDNGRSVSTNCYLCAAESQQLTSTVHFGKVSKKNGFIVDTACRVCGRVFAWRPWWIASITVSTVYATVLCPSVRLSVSSIAWACCRFAAGRRAGTRYRPSHHSEVARHCGEFAAVGPAGRRYRSTAAAAGRRSSTVFSSKAVRAVSRCQLT